MTVMGDQPKSPRFDTLTVHAGVTPEPTTGSIMTPIFQTSTYVQPAVAEPAAGRFDYGRSANPTRDALESSIAALEGGTHGLAFASGLSAIETVLKRLSAGDHVVSEENTYGGTSRLFTQVLARLGIEFTFVDTRSADAIAAAVRPATKLVHVETPTNPMMRICDLRAAARAAHAAGALLSVDNTYASPFNQRPLALGADIVIHSSTKYLNGHSDVIGGLLVVRDDTLAEDLRFLQNASGAVPGPMDCFLTLRGIKTLGVRMARHNQNGLAVARWLEENGRLERVIYPGLESHEQHALASRQMSGFSGMVTVDVGTLARAKEITESLRVFALAESLGGVESLVSVPALMTHSSVPEARRRAMGLTPGIVRFSAGIEDPADLVQDLAQALGK
jgi:cystathionine beta-lyase/cystathionine gamma-synthase